VDSAQTGLIFKIFAIFFGGNSTYLKKNTIFVPLKRGVLIGRYGSSVGRAQD
jgi:hypothetical protein